MSRKFFFSSRLHAALVAVATALVVAAPAEAQAVTGGKLFATGGTVDVVVQQGGITSYTSRLFLLRPDGTPRQHRPQHGRGQACDAWRAIPYGPGARVRDHPAQRRPNFLHGPSDGTRTASHTPWSRIPAWARFLVGFEDMFDGGDRDYDDNIFQFTGNLAPNLPPPADGQTPTSPTETPNAKPDVRPLKIREARRRLPKVLRKQYGRRFTSRRGPLTRSCSRLATVKVRCRVRWNTRRHRYSGSATMWKEQDDRNSILFTTSIRRTLRASA